MKKCTQTALKSPKAPPGLSAEARKWWKKITTEWALDDAGLLIFESALEAFDRMRQAQAILATEGIVLEDRFGQRKHHPATLIERDAKATLLRHLHNLNLDLEPLKLPPSFRNYSRWICPPIGSSPTP